MSFIKNNCHKFLIIFFAAFLIFSPFKTNARENVTDWYIKDYQSEIVVNKDSTADITENIVADCGNCVDKHGIYRVVPTRVYKSANVPIDMPIELVSITDFNGASYNYSQTTDKNNYTVSFKIGDPNKNVSGINNYRIKYKIKNVIRFDNSQFDEFYWNILGNFWDLEIDNFSAKVILPSEIVGTNQQVFLYSGDFKTAGNNLASSEWLSNNTLLVSASQTLAVGQGITVSITLPKNIFTPYQFTSKERANYAAYPLLISSPALYWTISIIGLSTPIIILILAIIFWKKYGRDPKVKKTIVPEFEIPENLAPIEMGMVESNGKMQNHFISAGIINLAVKGMIKIQKTEKQGVFSHEDFELQRLKKEAANLSGSEKILIDSLFESGNKVKISDLKYKFYQNVSEISGNVSDNMTKNDLLDKKGYYFRIGYLVTAALILGLASFLATFFPLLWISMSVSVLILTIFAFVMPRRTLKNINLWYRIQGFKLYMKTAEKYRQRFNEKENIFEKYLPYAILFDMTGLWIKKMEDLYGKEYVATYHPVWFAGGALASFDAQSFETTITQMSSTMASDLASSPSSSGAGGGGFSGGGGGGGGGGGW